MSASKRTPEARAVVLAVLRLGHFHAVAAKKAGISPSALSEWIAADEEMRREVAAIEADDQIRLLQVVKRAAVKDGDVKAAQWLLEKRHRAQWGKGAEVKGDESSGGGGRSGARKVPFGWVEVNDEGEAG